MPDLSVNDTSPRNPAKDRDFDGRGGFLRLRYAWAKALLVLAVCFACVAGFLGNTQLKAAIWCAIFAAFLTILAYSLNLRGTLALKITVMVAALLILALSGVLLSTYYGKLIPPPPVRTP
jgi:hypothetical protein